jgi:guanylate cyclase
MVKLTDYGIAEPLERWSKQGALMAESLKSDEDKSGSMQKIS